MAPRDSFLLRIDPTVLASVRAWAADDLRSVNGQIEFILRRALKDAGRLKSASDDKSADGKPKKKPAKKRKK